MVLSGTGLRLYGTPVRIRSVAPDFPGWWRVDILPPADGGLQFRDLAACHRDSHHYSAEPAAGREFFSLICCHHARR